jgi:G:T-mismatch repair DNA endonuclease (very short patch repair protein)
MSLKYQRRTKRTIPGKTYIIEPPTEKRSEVMRKIHVRKSSIEEILASAFRRNKIKFRRPKRIFGHPDFRIVGFK